jgi:hypothetical protein
MQTKIFDKTGTACGSFASSVSRTRKIAMRKSLAVVIVAGLVWALPAAAVDEHHPEQTKPASAPGAKVGTKAPPVQSTTSPKSAPTAAQSGMMMENMEKMQRQMEKIQATTDTTERKKLMREHMQTMQENMKAMHDMGGQMMTGGGQHGGMTMGDHKDMEGGDRMKHHDMKGGDMMKHHDMMKNRMDLMQMMMEQMLQHQSAQETVPAPK